MAIRKRQDPTELLRDITNRIRQPLLGVFALAFPEPQNITRDNGLYGYLYGKPIHRLASALSLDREILILFSTFEDQQQRTIKTAKELIDESGGRLDNIVTIIVHKDSEGNAKLPKWGRNVGLAVLPIFAGKMPDSSESLERYLCHELFSHDPFDVTGPVSNDEQFYGRRNEALDLARKLQTGQIRSSLGIRKIGKTSIMNRVISESRANHDCYCVVMDCSKDEIWAQNAEELMSSLASAVRRCTGEPGQYVHVSGKASALGLSEATNELLNAVLAANKSVLIFIDEVDYITPGSPTSSLWKDEFNKFWRNFRSVYQEVLRHDKCLSMMVSGVSAKWFSVGTINGVENASLSLIPEEYLSPLPRRASQAMIRRIAKTAGLTMSDDTADAVAASTSDMPFWIRKACSYIHRNIEISGRPVTVEVAQAAALVTEFLGKEGGTLGQVAISHLFRVYPELKDPCLLILEGKIDGIRPTTLTILRKYGLVAANNPIKLSGPMIEGALRSFHEQQAIESDQVSQQGNPEMLHPSALVEWAEELAVINKERNLLEKRLRTMIVNFLRADGIQNKQRGTARERILVCIPSERRNALQNLPPDEVIERVYWSDLKAIVNKEWSVFSSVFADKRHFDQHFEIINDRPDTHAKDADHLDIISQRRSLKWVTDRVNSV